MTFVKNILLPINYISPDIEKYINENLNIRILNAQQQQEMDLSCLTAREASILKLIANGFTNLEIANKLFISVATVQTHRKRIKKKLSVSTLSELIKLGNSML